MDDVYFYIHCSVAECPPVGNLRDLEPDDMPDSEYGLYFLPQPIHYTSGRLISVTTNGFYNPSVQSNSIICFLFQQKVDGSYCQAPNIFSIQLITLEM